MTDALEFYIKDWERIIWDATGDQTKVDRLMELARLNGMFDPVKMVPAPQALAATPAVGGEVLAKRLDNMARHQQENLTGKGRFNNFLNGNLAHEAAAFIRAIQPASPLRGMEDLAPSPCSDLSIGELIEWLDNPQWTNGYLNSDAANHMSAAAELIKRLVSSAPPEQPAAWQCHAKLRPEVSGCMWPDCGCEPRSTEIIAALVEQGWTPPQPAAATVRFGEPVWPTNDEANDLDKGDDA